jgi:HK97 family phage prohead protease
MPKMLLQHGMGFGALDNVPIGTWTKMEEDEVGLYVEGQLFALNTERGQYIYEGLKAGALDGLSIGYKALDFTYGMKQGDPRRTLKKVRLDEVSILTVPSNDKARVGAVKSAADYTPQDWRALEAVLRDEGLSRSDSVKAVSGFKAYLQRDAGVSDPAPRDETAAEEQQLRELAGRIRALSA